MATWSASAKMEALGSVVEQLLITLERTKALSHDDTTALLKAAIDSFEAGRPIRDATRDRAREYVEHLGQFVRECRLEP